MHSNNSTKPLKGVTCEVNNCMYHDGASHCVAGQIKVAPHSATTSDETICDTFKNRQ